MDKLEAFCDYVEVKKKYQPITKIFNQYIVKVLDNNNKPLIKDNEYDDFFEYTKNTFVHTDIMRYKKDFEEKAVVKLEDLKVGDTIYYNLNEFDCVKPESLRCEILKIDGNDIYLLSKDSKMLVDANELGSILTKNPIYNERVEREGINHGRY